jgi:Na+-transporting NADH:ubiquinone oxidoreductase subunit A
MRHIASKLIFTLVAMLSVEVLSAQSTDGSSWVFYSLIAVAILVFFFIVVQVSDNLLAIEAKQVGVDTNKTNLSLFPSIKELFRPGTPEHLTGKSVTFLSRGTISFLRGLPMKRLTMGYYQQLLLYSQLILLAFHRFLSWQ